MNILLISDNRTAYLFKNISKMDITNNYIMVNGFHENQLSEVYINVKIEEKDRVVWLEKIATDETSIFKGSLIDFDYGVFVNTNTDEEYGYYFDFDVK